MEEESIESDGHGPELAVLDHLGPQLVLLHGAGDGRRGAVVALRLEADRARRHQTPAQIQLTFGQHGSLNTSGH